MIEIEEYSDLSEESSFYKYNYKDEFCQFILILE